MGTFNVTIGVGHSDNGSLTEVSAMVDTGAKHTTLPRSLLTELNIEVRDQREFTLADGSEVSGGFGQARIALDGMDWVCPVVFGPEGQYILGATTLETFNLMVDPMDERLVPKILRARPF